MIAAAHTLRGLRRAGRLIVDAVLPPQCLSCGAATDAPGHLCAACWSGIVWLAAPLCACCGAPFEFDAGANMSARNGGGGEILCGACLRRRPVFDRARAVFRYDDRSRRLVLAFKHADRTHAAPAYGAWLARAGAALLADADLIVPVPLHWTRLAWRRYNQAALLAHAVAAASAIPCAPDLVLRNRRTKSQGVLGAAARRRNISRAFRVHPARAHLAAGKRIVLIDDVFTTGATTEECAAALRDAGAARVDVLTLARVVRVE